MKPKIILIKRPTCIELSKLKDILSANLESLYSPVDAEITELFARIDDLRKTHDLLALWHRKFEVTRRIIQRELCYMHPEKIMGLLFYRGETSAFVTACNDIDLIGSDLLAYAMRTDVNTRSLEGQPFCFRNTALIKFLIEDRHNLIQAIRTVNKYTLANRWDRFNEYVRLFLPSVNQEYVTAYMQRLTIESPNASLQLYCSYDRLIPQFPIIYRGITYDLMSKSNFPLEVDHAADFDMQYLEKIRALQKKPTNIIMMINIVRGFIYYNRSVLIAQAALFVSLQGVLWYLYKSNNYSYGINMKSKKFLCDSLFGALLLILSAFESRNRVPTNYCLNILDMTNFWVGFANLCYLITTIGKPPTECSTIEALDDYLYNAGFNTLSTPYCIYMCVFATYIMCFLSVLTFLRKPFESQQKLGDLPTFAVQQEALFYKNPHGAIERSRVLTLCFNRIIKEGTAQTELAAPEIIDKIVSYTAPKWH